MTREELIDKCGVENSQLIDRYLHIEDDLKRFERIDLSKLATSSAGRFYISLLSQYNAIHKTLLGRADDESGTSPLREWANGKLNVR